jgi:hypothetical protein
MQIFKTLRFATWRAFGFWHLASFITDALLLTAFILRVYGLASPEGNRDQLLLRSFQVLSFVSPFIWCVLVYSEAHRNQEPPSRTSASVFSLRMCFRTVLILNRTRYCVRWPQVCWDHANMRFSDVSRVRDIFRCRCSLECIICTNVHS